MWLIALLVIALACGVAVRAADAGCTLRVTVDGWSVLADAVVHDGTAYLPVDPLAKALGLSVRYDVERRTLYLDREAKLLPAGAHKSSGDAASKRTRPTVIRLGTSEAGLPGDIAVYVGGRLLLARACVLGDVTYVPLRAVAEALGMSVHYDAKRRAVEVRSGPQLLPAGLTSQGLRC